MEDDLRAEYDLKSLTVRRLGSQRKSFGRTTVKLDPDVAEVFPNAEAVNEALRFLIRVTRSHQEGISVDITEQASNPTQATSTEV